MYLYNWISPIPIIGLRFEMAINWKQFLGLDIAKANISLYFLLYQILHPVFRITYIISLLEDLIFYYNIP